LFLYIKTTIKETPILANTILKVLTTSQDMASKCCSRCNVSKSVNDFKKMTAARDGIQSYCKVCSNEVYQQWRENNRDYYNDHERNYQTNNPQRRINKNVHSKLNNILRRGIYSVRTEEILGVPKVLYLDWLSFNFENNMCFANYAKVWQINLVIPASAFDLTNEQQLLACFNWRNTRPCLKSDNLAKYNFICPFAQANQSIRILAFSRKMQQLAIDNNQILI